MNEIIVGTLIKFVTGFYIGCTGFVVGPPKGFVEVYKIRVNCDTRTGTHSTEANLMRHEFLTNTEFEALKTKYK